MSSSPVVHDAARVEAITTLAGLEALGPEWERLWMQSLHATPFQSPWWLLPWWKHLGRGTLASIAVRCAGTGELAALAPLYLDADRATGRRRLFPIGITTTDFLDVLLRPGWEAVSLRCLASHLAQRAGDWDLLEFPQLRRGAALLALPAPAAWRQEIAPGEPSPVLPLSDAVAGRASAIPAAMARNVRYCRGRAQRVGNLACRTADARSIPAFFEALVRLHTRRWSERGSAGVLNDASVLAWHREAMPLLHEAGLLRLHALLQGGEIIAVLFCLADGAHRPERCCYYYLGGFDPRLRSLSPGTLLVAYAIDQAVAEGARAFDFLRGAEAYKYRWGAVDQPTSVLRLWPAHLPAHSLQAP
jgi:CelD/BcsL family acetyltransferase involved in cellulose biosynthesis